jgi:DNA topoisomerase-6 subunit B
MEVRVAEEIFKEFKEHSIAEFFKKNRQMLGYSGMVRSLVTVVHEYVTNSLDACEEAGILPDIEVVVKETGENRYSVRVSDNGPGVPKAYIGKALATVLAGTKFHRYVQQRGQQGIGAAGCTLFSQITTGKGVSVKSSTGKGKAFTCKIALDTVRNKPIVTELAEMDDGPGGLSVEGEFADVKYENSDHGVYEYLKRTALSNPHCQIKFIDPEGKENLFVRSVNVMPARPEATLPHPLGLSVNDLLDFAHLSQSRKVSSFLVDTFARVTSNKVAELKEIAKGVDFDKDPGKLTWPEAEELIKAIRTVKWIAPEATSIVPVGKEQISIALKNILNPDFMNVIQRKPRVFRGGVPFVIEAAVCYGGNSGTKTDEGHAGTMLRFANRVPLLFDASNCALTDAMKGVLWKRYNIDLDTQPVSILVSICSVHVPYAGVGKEAVSKEDEIIDEAKLAIMDAARGVQQYIRGKQHASFEANRYKTTMRYVKQLAKDISDLTGYNEGKVEEDIKALTLKHYPHMKEKGDGDAGPEDGGDADPQDNKTEEEEQ